MPEKREVLQAAEIEDLLTLLDVHRKAIEVMEMWQKKAGHLQYYEINLELGDDLMGIPHYIEVVVCEDELEE